MKLLPKPEVVRRIVAPNRSVGSVGSVGSGGLSHGAEIAFGVLVFFGIGFAVDYFLGTTPLFMIVLTVFSCIGNFAKIWYGYDANMKKLEAERAEMRRVPSGEDKKRNIAHD